MLICFSMAKYKKARKIIKIEIFEKISKNISLLNKKGGYKIKVTKTKKKILRKNDNIGR